MPEPKESEKFMCRTVIACEHYFKKSLRRLCKTKGYPKDFEELGEYMADAVGMANKEMLMLGMLNEEYIKE